MPDTSALIQRLVSEARPVTPLRPPWRRTLHWIVWSLPFVTLVVLWKGPRPDLALKLSDGWFLAQEAAALATALSAAFAALLTTIPGRTLLPLLAPGLPLAIWLGSLSPGCISALLDLGGTGERFTNDWICLPNIALAGAAPALVMAFMIRQGVPMSPHLTLAYGGLAAAALGDAGLRLFHPSDASLTVIIWQMGSVAGLTAISSAAGRWAHAWWHD